MRMSSFERIKIIRQADVSHKIGKNATFMLARVTVLAKMIP